MCTLVRKKNNNFGQSFYESFQIGNVQALHFFNTELILLREAGYLPIHNYLFIFTIWNLSVLKMIQNQRISTFGSNQSQEEFSRKSGKSSAQNGTLRKRIQFMSELISKNVINLIRFCCCIFLGLMLSSNISAQRFKQLSSGIVASNDILLDKGVRGVFPSLQGTLEQLRGVWQLAAMTSKQNTSSNYNKYRINFKENKDVQLTNIKCKGDIKLKTYIYYYNIFFTEKENGTGVSEERNENEMEIPNQKQDIECIRDDGKFMNILKNSSIWSIHANNLYIISELRNNKNVLSTMLIFNKK